MTTAASATRLRAELFGRPMPATESEALRDIYDTACRVLDQGGYGASADTLRRLLGMDRLPLRQIAAASRNAATAIRTTYPTAAERLDAAAAALEAP